jgi:hypothetical protein
MRVLTCLLAFGLLFGLSGVAKADTDFQMVVIDPFTGPYVINPINGTSVSFMFTECEEPGQLPAGSPAFDGCWSGQNDNTFALTSLTIVVPPIVGQTAGCTPFGSIGGDSDLFTNATCSTNTNGFLLSFTGGAGLAPGGIVTIAEAGVDPGVFPEVMGTFNAPEPPAFWLMFTGVLAGGLFLSVNRRRALAVLPSQRAD